MRVDWNRWSNPFHCMRVFNVTLETQFLEFPWQTLQRAFTSCLSAPVAAFPWLAPSSSLPSFFYDPFTRFASQTFHPGTNVEHVVFFQAESSVVIDLPRPSEVIEESAAIRARDSGTASLKNVTIPRKHTYNVTFKFLAIIPPVEFVDSGTRWPPCSIATVKQHAGVYKKNTAC